MTTRLNNARRYFLRKYQTRETMGVELGIASLYLAKHDLQPGTVLDPALVPHVDLLASALYTTFEDLDGADAEELMFEAGLSAKQAQAVIRAVTPFPVGQLMQTRSPLGHPFASAKLVMSLADLKALDVIEHVNGEAFFLDDGRVVRWVNGSVLTADDIFVIAPTTGSGRYVLATGFVSDVPIAFDFNVADAAVLATLPTGMTLLVRRAYWEVTTGFTGGSSSAIGLSSSQAPATTKGDIHGGSGGDVAATLVPGAVVLGTIGADVAAGVILTGGATIKFDRITSAFTAGVGKAHLVVEVLRSPA